MQEPITYVGVDAHKGELQVAMLIGYAAMPTTWIVTNEQRAVERWCASWNAKRPVPPRGAAGE